MTFMPLCWAFSSPCAAGFKKLFTLITEILVIFFTSYSLVSCIILYSKFLNKAQVAYGDKKIIHLFHIVFLFAMMFLNAFCLTASAKILLTQSTTDFQRNNIFIFKEQKSQKCLKWKFISLLHMLCQSRDQSARWVIRKLIIFSTLNQDTKKPAFIKTTTLRYVIERHLGLHIQILHKIDSIAYKFKAFWTFPRQNQKQYEHKQQVTFPVPEHSTLREWPLQRESTLSVADIVFIRQQRRHITFSDEDKFIAEHISEFRISISISLNEVAAP